MNDAVISHRTAPAPAPERGQARQAYYADTPDFVALYEAFQNLSRGDQALLRRARTPDDVGCIPATYYLLQSASVPGRQWNRLVFFLPYVAHADTKRSVGATFADAGISERRLVHMVRAPSPNDLIQLRRLLIQADTRVNWADLARTLWFWGDRSKERVVAGYYLKQ